MDGSETDPNDAVTSEMTHSRKEHLCLQQEITHPANQKQVEKSEEMAKVQYFLTTPKKDIALHSLT